MVAGYFRVKTSSTQLLLDTFPVILNTEPINVEKKLEERSNRDNVTGSMGSS